MSRRERELRRLARELGWTLTHGGKHWLLRHPSGAVASATDTPGDRRDLRNLAAKLRRKIAAAQGNAA